MVILRIQRARLRLAWFRDSGSVPVKALALQTCAAPAG
jgi:hypothetical protein